MRILVVLFTTVALVACSTLGSLALDALSPDKGGINTEIVVGDKE